jgi:2,3-bisphosphoglycerate-dependent phosphoglycerate mutase
MRLYFVRHGESEANVLREVSNRDFKHPLTEKGREQSWALARSLQGMPVARLFTSPLMRAVETAEILTEALGVPYELTDALREYDCGILEGRSDDECWRLHGAQREAWLKDRRWDERIEGGESFYDIRDRFVPFVETLRQRYTETNVNIILVGHGGTYGCMLPLLLENVSFDMLAQLGFPNTGAVIAESTPNGLTCISSCEHPLST